MFVVCAHYLNNFWFRQKPTAGFIHAPPLENLDPPLLAEIFHLIPVIQFGEFGVALFFLISGFLIPLSLERYGVLPFLIGRFFRIWPLYIAGLSVTLLFLYGLSVYLERTFPFSLSQMLVQSAIFLRDWLHYPNIDGIVWTLEIEIKFYLFMAIWFGVTKKLDYQKIVFFMIILCLAIIILRPLKSFMFYNVKPLYYMFTVISFNAAMISYMLCGTALYMVLQKRLSVREILPFLVVLMACFVGTWVLGFYGAGRYAIPQYFMALAVFAACFAFRDYFRPNRLLDWLANISYPLYVVHAAAGYTIIYLLVAHGWPESISLALAVLFAFTMATLLHHLVEHPTHLVGKSLARLAGKKARAP